MFNHSFVADVFANALRAGPWDEEAMVGRLAEACGQRHRWLRPLVRRALEFSPSERPGSRQLLAFLLADDKLTERCPMHLGELAWPRDMEPLGEPARSWPVPELTTAAQVADWLGLTHSELDWFADLSHRNRKSPARLRHYGYRWQPGNNGKVRLLEMPKARLKAIQRQLLHEILDRIPPHDAAHGYRPGRSVLSYVSPHADRGVILHFDLRDFFPSVRASRVHALFRVAGYPEGVARTLAGLCTSDVPEDVLRTSPMRGHIGWHRTASHFRFAHLPQGAPTSPALANLATFRLDCRLAGLARSLAATYTRYADDLTFSGDEPLWDSTSRVRRSVDQIVTEEGFALNPKKTRVMSRGVSQRVAGVVVNVRPNVPRREYDTLKAILTNCERHGPASQNRDGHADFRGRLAGKIAYVAMVNPEKGRRLREMFERISGPG